MIRNLKVLGLALAAVLAMSAVAASVSQAAATATAGSYPAIIEAEQTTQQVFTSQSRTIKCSTAKFNGALAAPSTTLTLKVTTYSGCTSTISGTGHFATITMNECHYLFHFSGSSPFYVIIPLDVICPAGKQIEIHIYESDTTEDKQICKLGVPAQTGLSSIALTNTGSGSTADVDAALSVTGIATNVLEGSSVVCGTSNKTAKLEGGATIKAKNEGGSQVGASISG